MSGAARGVLATRVRGRQAPRRQPAFILSADPAEVVFGRQVDVVIDLHAGNATATVWTSDLTHDYVEENSAYST